MQSQQAMSPNILGINLDVNRHFRMKRGGKRPPVENSDWARSWKRWIQPRVGLKAVEPVLYTTGHRNLLKS